MARKVFNMAGGMHSAAAYSAFENAVYKGTCRASEDAFKVTAKSGMTVTVAEGDGLIDTGEKFSRRVQIDAAENVTIPVADTTYDRKDLLVLFVDNTVKPNLEVVDNVNNILKLKVVQGTPAASPSEPTESMIQSAIGATNPYMRLAVITVKANATAVTTANIEDARPASPNVYFAPQIEHTTISWYGCTLDLRKYGKVVTLTCGQPLTIQVPKQGSEPGKIPEGWRPYEGIGISILFDLYPDFAGRINIGANGNWDWFATGGMNPNLYPTINATWMTP